MKICIKIGNVRHCYTIPVFELPIRFHPVGPGPVNFPELFQDGVLLASLQNGVEKISEKSVREALERGIDGAVQALQKRGGEHVTIDMHG